MRRKILTYCFGIIACSTALAGGFAPRAQALATSTREGMLKTFLREYLTDSDPRLDKTTRYYPVFGRLSESGVPAVVVYITGQSWCGSGGCATLILVSQGSSYKVVTEISITRPPIRLLGTRSNGWRDLSVHVQGGGIQPGYDAELSYDGKTYPSNPSVPPAKRLQTQAEGEVIVPLSAEGTLL